MRKYLSIVALLLLVSVTLTACGLSEAETKYNAGTDKFNAGDIDGALADFNEAIRLDPNLAVAYMNRGAVWATKNEPDKAIEDETKALDLKLSRVEDQATALVNRAGAYAAKGDFDKGIADADEAIKVRSDYSKAFYIRGICNMSKQQNDAAITDFKKVIELAKDSSEGKAAQQYLDQLQAPTP
ncbi:MAG TPA: tetratricopeptide repeat protein [Chloroflexia bacterium]|nr:tetratricopeptide repeat protein [Chloroflexia bacterium]